MKKEFTLQCSKKSNGAGERSGTQVIWRAAERAEGIEPGEKEVQGRLYYYNYLKGGCGEMGVSLSS